MLNVNDYVPANAGRDVSDEIQKLIDENPNRTLHFGDGTYLLKKTVLTPADPEKSVDLRLDTYAVFEADEGFTGGPLVALGGKDAANNVRIPGSNYGFTGGILDGRGIADGIHIVSGRETAIRDVSMKNVVAGIYIRYGANNGSSDADITGVNIIGNRTKDSCGIVIDAYDNSVTNVRIGGIHTGVKLLRGGNTLRNVHPLYYMGEEYESSTGFIDDHGNNFYSYCYSDQFATGWLIGNGGASVLTDCVAFWYTGKGGVETALRAEKQYNALVHNMKIGFSQDTLNTVLTEGEAGGRGRITNLLSDESRFGSDETWKKYFDGSVVG